MTTNPTFTYPPTPKGVDPVAFRRAVDRGRVIARAAERAEVARILRRADRVGVVGN